MLYDFVDEVNSEGLRAWTAELQPAELRPAELQPAELQTPELRVGSISVTRLQQCCLEMYSNQYAHELRQYSHREDSIDGQCAQHPCCIDFENFKT